MYMHYLYAELFFALASASIPKRFLVRSQSAGIFDASDNTGLQDSPKMVSAGELGEQAGRHPVGVLLLPLVIFFFS